MNIGKAIKILRIERDIDQRGLSTLCGFDKSYISLIESNKRDPSFKSLVKISKSLKLNVSDLFLLAEHLK